MAFLLLISILFYLSIIYILLYIFLYYMSTIYNIYYLLLLIILFLYSNNYYSCLYTILYYCLYIIYISLYIPLLLYCIVFSVHCLLDGLAVYRFISHSPKMGSSMTKRRRVKGGYVRVIRGGAFCYLPIILYRGFLIRAKAYPVGHIQSTTIDSRTICIV